MKKYILVLIVLLYSCGARKVNIDKNTTQIEEALTETIIIKDTSNVKIKFDYEYNNFTIEAKDNLKPFVYNGKKYYNVVLKHENKKDNSLYKETKKVLKTENKQLNTLSKQTIKQKQVERSNDSIYWWIIVILVLLLLIAYRKQLRLILLGI